MNTNQKFTLIFLLTIGIIIVNNQLSHKKEFINKVTDLPEKRTKKTLEERQLFSEERALYEFNMQKNPITGEIPLEEKQKEFENANLAKQKSSSQRITSNLYIQRGPSNLGGRTRALVIDKSDNTSNTIIAGGVSGGVFRTTNGGESWTKVSSNDEIHNVTAIAQDPRPGFQNIWYYGTGEWRGNSASLGAAYRGSGIWKSIDNGINWSQISETNSVYESFDSYLDYIMALEVSPINGDLMIAATGKISRYDGSNLVIEIEEPSNGTGWTDVVINNAGVVYAAIEGTSSENGVWTSQTGNGSWSRIAQNGSPSSFNSTVRTVLGTAPSNNNIIYALFTNGDSGNIEADLWQYNSDTDTWTDYSSKLPDEPGGDSSGNDPFAVQGGYDLVVSVNPRDENFVVIGGTNIYKIEDIVNDSSFSRIGGYASNTSYGLYSIGGVQHHPDIHALVFDPNNEDVLFSGTDGGVHKSLDVDKFSVAWENLNNNYITYQFYHVALDSEDGSNAVIGGAQDNGTKIGGTDLGLEDNTQMSSFYSGDGVAVGITQRDGDFQFYYGSQNGNMRTNYPSFRSIDPNGSVSQFVTYFYLDPDNTNALYYAGGNRVYKTADAENITSSSWDDLGTLPSEEDIRSYATTRGDYDTATSYMLIGGESGGIFRLNDPQNSTDVSNATNITPSEASITDGTIVSGLAIHPTNPDIVLAVYSNYGINNIFITTDATSNTPTWTLVERNLDAHSIRSAAIVAFENETIYMVGTARGLYASDDPLNNDWEIEGSDKIGLAVVSGLALRTTDNVLLVGTHGNGMFETSVQQTLSSNSYLIENSINLYPNPTKFELNLQGNTINFESEITYRISDINGKILQRGTVANRKINVEELKTGVYLIDLNVDGKRETSKFIKN